MDAWIESNKSERPFEAGALAYIAGHNPYYGCHYGMKSTAEWARQQFTRGWDIARLDCINAN